MSNLVPDFFYDPYKNNLISSKPENDEIIDHSIELSTDDLVKAIQEFSKQFQNSELKTFLTNTTLTFKTSAHVFDSVDFFTKFSQCFTASIKKTFPNLTENQLEELQTKLEEIEKILAKTLKGSNIENKLLLPLSLGILSGVLNYKSY